ncbi:MAG TPA: hypothetical protein VJ904_07625 [Tichowtungia sp.]|nr:hypothetical protein [Tichowtungia sp.]
MDCPLDMFDGFGRKKRLPGFLTNPGRDVLNNVKLPVMLQGVRYRFFNHRFSHNPFLILPPEPDYFPTGLDPVRIRIIFDDFTAIQQRLFKLPYADTPGNTLINGMF